MGRWDAVQMTRILCSCSSATNGVECETEAMAGFSAGEQHWVERLGKLRNVKR